MQPTDILKKYKTLDSKEKIDSFFARMRKNGNCFNEYLLDRVTKGLPQELINYIIEKRIEYIKNIPEHHYDRNKLYMEDEKRTLTKFDSLSVEEIRSIKQRKFEKRMIIYTPQGGRNKKY